jgi:hypothetical protein
MRCCLGGQDNTFSPACIHFSDDEKEAVFRYCKRANRQEPKGFCDCGLLIVFSHRCPSNSVPALHAANDRWQGLFPRNC